MSDSSKRIPELRKIKTSGLLVLVLVVTFLVYLPLFNNDFLMTWDDDRYIIENPHIKELSFTKTFDLFGLYYDGHYHPLTLLSLAIDYQVDELNPKVFHTTNLIFHLANTLLVFWLVFLLVKRKSLVVPFVTSMLFGISTMHVESVAWGAERKNVLYAFFFLASLISYIHYLNNRKLLPLIISIFLFGLSLFSKAMALPLCFTLLAVDYFFDRKLLSKKALLEKAPYFALAILFGIISVQAQKSTWGEDLSQVDYPFYERIFYASWAFVAYLFKLIIPVKLAGLYPYPKEFSGMFVVKSFVALLAALASVYWFIKTFRKKSFLQFGYLFFVINVFLLLKLFDVPAGDYIMADRYAYIPSIGLFIIGGVFLDKFMDRSVMVKRGSQVLFVLLVIFISIQTLQRVTVFKTDEDFYTDIIEKYSGVGVAHTNRGAILREQGRIREAIKDFDAAIKSGNKGYREYSNRGVMYMESGEFNKALPDLQKAVNLNPYNIQVMASYGFALLQTGNFTQSINVFNEVLKLQPDHAEALSNRGTARYSTGDLEGAIGDYTKALEIKPEYNNAYFNRGLARINTNELVGAIADLEKAIDINPENAEAYSNLGVAHSRSGNMTKAFDCYSRAIEINPVYFEAYLNRGIDYFFTQAYDQSLNDLNKAIEINSQLGASFYFRGRVKIALNQSDACDDFNQALQLGFRMASDKIKEHCK